MKVKITQEQIQRFHYIVWNRIHSKYLYAFRYDHKLSINRVKEKVLEELFGGYLYLTANCLCCHVGECVICPLELNHLCRNWKILEADIPVGEEKLSLISAIKHAAIELNHKNYEYFVDSKLYDAILKII